MAAPADSPRTAAPPGRRHMERTCAKLEMRRFNVRSDCCQPVCPLLQEYSRNHGAVMRSSVDKTKAHCGRLQ